MAPIKFVQVAPENTVSSIIASLKLGLRSVFGAIMFTLTILVPFRLSCALAWRMLKKSDS